MALIYRLSQFRDIFVSNLCTKILGINNNNNLSKDYCLLIFLNFIPYFITSFFLNLLQVQYLYKKDDIIYYSNENDTVLGPILLEAYLNNNDIKSILDRYDNNVPLNLIFQNENLKVEDGNTIKIKCMTLGKIKEKIFNYKLVKFNLKIQLLFLI